jgi:hypothetical protein
MLLRALADEFDAVERIEPRVPDHAQMARSVVVLPAPLAPSSVVTPPS